MGCASNELVAETFRIDRRDDRGATAPTRPTLAQIGTELRPLAVGREPSIVATVDGVATQPGRNRAAVGLPPEGIGRGRLELSWGLPGGATFTRFKRSWRLRAHPRRPARGKLVFTSPLGDRTADLVLQLERTLPPPVRLESEAFDVPPGATIEVGYGVAPMRTAPAAATMFSAALRCAWSWRRTIVDARVGAGGAAAGQWHDAAMVHTAGGRDCRLTLESDSRNATGEALWAIPRLRAPARTTNDTNVVLISLDTLRADHMSGYWYVRPTTPAIDDAMVKRGTLFTEAVTTFPVTNVAHLGMFTSRYAGMLPADGRLRASLPIPMLTEILRDAGFSTLGVTEDGLVSHAYGFGWGFDRLVEHYHAPLEGAERVFADGRRLLEAHRDRRFFLFLHTYKVHDPYTPSEPYRVMFPASPDDSIYRNVPRQHRPAFDAYDRCIRELDARVAEFLGTLDAMGLAERTLVVLTSDHGEAFGEHGMTGHGFTPYQEEVHVPLVFRGPGITAGHRVITPVSLTDVMPTILDLLGLSGPAEMQGRSLRDGVAGGQLPNRPVFFEWFGGGVGARMGQNKIVRMPGGMRTYHPLVDREERAPRRGAMPDVEAAIERYVDDGARWRQGFDAARTPTAISPELRDALRGLGYIE